MSFVATAPTVPNPWARILGALEKKVNRQSFDTWLKPTRFSHITGRILFVRVPTPEFQHIGDRYGDLIQEAIDAFQLEFDDVSFVIPQEDPDAVRVAKAPPRAKGTVISPWPPASHSTNNFWISSTASAMRAKRKRCAPISRFALRVRKR